MNDYERGYRDGTEHFKAQMKILYGEVGVIRSKLSDAAIFITSDQRPKPNIILWLVLDGGIITPGFFVGGVYLALSGIEVYPSHWAAIPPSLRSQLGEEE